MSKTTDFTVQVPLGGSYVSYVIRDRDGNIFGSGSYYQREIDQELREALEQLEK